MPQPPNMNQMLKQVQQMQAEMMKAQESLKDDIVEASAGGGMVTVKVSGELEIKDLTIDPEAVDPEAPGGRAGPGSWPGRPLGSGQRSRSRGLNLQNGGARGGLCKLGPPRGL